MITQDEEYFLKQVGARLKELRIEHGYTSYEPFAYDAEIPRAQYGRYERGQNLTMVNLYRIIRFLKITPEEFFSKGFEDNRPKAKKKV